MPQVSWAFLSLGEHRIVCTARVGVEWGGGGGGVKRQQFNRSCHFMAQRPEEMTPA